MAIPYFLRTTWIPTLFLIGFLARVYWPFHQLDCKALPNDPKHLTRVTAKVVERATGIRTIYVPDNEPASLQQALKRWTDQNPKKLPVLFMIYDHEVAAVHLISYHWVVRTLTESAYEPKQSLGLEWGKSSELTSDGLALLLGLAGQALERKLDVSSLQAEIQQQADYHRQHLWETSTFEIGSWSIKIQYFILGITFVLFCSWSSNWRRVWQGRQALMALREKYPSQWTNLPTLWMLLISTDPQALAEKTAKCLEMAELQVREEQKKSAWFAEAEADRERQELERAMREQQRQAEAEAREQRLKAELDGILISLGEINPDYVPEEVRNEFREKRDRCRKMAERKKLSLAVSWGREALQLLSKR